MINNLYVLRYLLDFQQHLLPYILTLFSAQAIIVHSLDNIIHCNISWLQLSNMNLISNGYNFKVFHVNRFWSIITYRDLTHNRHCPKYHHTQSLCCLILKDINNVKGFRQQKFIVHWMHTYILTNSTKFIVQRYHQLNVSVLYHDQGSSGLHPFKK